MPRSFSIVVILCAGCIAACGSIARPIWETSAEATGTTIAQIVSPTPRPLTATPPAILTPSPAPSATPSATHTPQPAAETPAPTATRMPTEPPAAAALGDAANGQVLFNTMQSAVGFACVTCHLADSEQRLLGPGLLNLGSRAESRVPGMDALTYIRTSILEPGAFVVPDYPDNLMPRTWGELYTPQEIDDIIAYLLTLRG